MSSYLENKILNHILRGENYTPPSTVYVGLVSGTAVDADLEGGDLTNEITGYEGDRKAITFTSASQVSDKGQTANSNEIDFNGMPATTVAYSVVCDSATGGNILYWLPANNNKTTNADDTFRLRVADVTITQD